MLEALVHRVDAEIEIMVSYASNVDLACVEAWHHLLSFKDRADETRSEQVTREQSQAFHALSGRSFLIMFHSGDETRCSTLVWLPLVLLDVVHIVEVQDSQLLILACALTQVSLETN